MKIETVEDIEKLLRHVAKHQYENGYFELEIDAILATAPPITLSENFRERALKAMEAAQAKRMEAKG